MKLRARFALLVVGTIVVPLLVTSLVFLVRFWVASRSEPVPNYTGIAAWLRDVPPGPRQDLLELFASRRPKGVQLIAIDSRDKVLLSTIPGFPPGRRIDEAALLDYLREKSFSYLFDDPGFGIIPALTDDPDSSPIQRHRLVDKHRQQGDFDH